MEKEGKSEDDKLASPVILAFARIQPVARAVRAFKTTCAICGKNRFMSAILCENKKHRFWMGAMLLILGLSLCRISQATTIIPLSLEDQFKTAQDVLELESKSYKDVWNKGKKGIYRTVKFRIIRVYKGNQKEGDQFQSKFRGGQVGNIAQHVAGSPLDRVKPGAKLFGFFLPTGAPLGLSWGIYPYIKENREIFIHIQGTLPKWADIKVVDGKVKLIDFRRILKKMAH